MISCRVPYPFLPPYSVAFSYAAISNVGDGCCWGALRANAYVTQLQVIPETPRPTVAMEVLILQEDGTGERKSLTFGSPDRLTYLDKTGII
jgi:hypothetical protein